MTFMVFPWFMIDNNGWALSLARTKKVAAERRGRDQAAEHFVQEQFLLGGICIACAQGQCLLCPVSRRDGHTCVAESSRIVEFAAPPHFEI